MFLNSMRAQLNLLQGWQDKKYNQTQEKRNNEEYTGIVSAFRLHVFPFHYW